MYKTTINNINIGGLLRAPVGTTIRDAWLKGFEARRSLAGVSYHYIFREGNHRIRVSIGRHPQTTPLRARVIANNYALMRAQGHNPLCCVERYL